FSAGNSYTAFGASEVTATLQYLWHEPGINFNFFMKYTGPQPFLFIDATGEAFYNGHQSGYGICDFSVEKKLCNRKVQVILGVKNIFDVQFVKTTGVTMSSSHSGGMGAAGNMLPRSVFTSININIDK